MKARSADIRLRKHADYQRVYRAGQKRSSRQMSYFVAAREQEVFEGSVPRVGLTVGKVIGKAVDRNRIKRRMREAVRAHVSLLPPDVDVILHPRRSVLEIKFDDLLGEVSRVFRAVKRDLQSPPPSGHGQSRARS
jgi:ribonuclease P protein component